MATPDYASMSDDDLLSQIKPRASAPAPQAAAPAAAPNYSTMSDDDLLASLPARTPPPPAQPQRSTGEQLGRQVGLTVRHGINGLAALPAAATDAITGAANSALDLTVGKGTGPRFGSSAKALDDTLTNIGLPKPETAQERVVGDATSALAGAGGVVKAGQALAARATAPTTQAVGGALAADPALQAASAVASGGAAGLAREAGGGDGAQLAAGLAGALVPGVATAPFRRVMAPGGAQTRDSAQKANAAGYVVPPPDLASGPVTELLSSLSGKAKTAQVASARNQSVSNSLARRALGIGDDVPLNGETLEGIRRQAAQAYAPVAGSGTVVPGKTYTAALDKALSPFSSASSSFPSARVPKVVDDINALRSGQFDAGDGLNMIRTLRESADIAYRAGENQAGKAYKSAAGALEDAIEGHLKGLGQPGGDLLKNFRDARQTIAKSYSVQKSLNEQTGAVNAVRLGAELAKGRPLSGELRTIAEAGQAFPKATQALREAPKANSVLDAAAVLGTGIATGSPLALGLFAARPTARSILLSRSQQAKAVRNAGTTSQAVPESAPAILANSAVQSTGGQEGRVYGNRLQAGAAARAAGGTVVPVPGGFAVRSP